MKPTKKNRILAAMLAASMLFAAAPVQALATEVASAEAEQTTAQAVSVDEVQLDTDVQVAADADAADAVQDAAEQAAQAEPVQTAQEDTQDAVATIADAADEFDMASATPLTITGGTISAGSYYLTDDIDLTGTLTISGTVYLSLNGHTIDGGDSYRVFTVGSNATLNLFDSAAGTGIVTGGWATDSGGAVYLSEGATFNLYGGTICENRAASNGGAVYGAKSTFNMYGGCISNNTVATGAGDAIYLQESAFLLAGGSITNHTASGYSAIDLRSCTTEMTGGSIAENTVTGSGLGCVGVYGGSFTMRDGTITENTVDCTYMSAAVQLGYSAEFIMTGGSITKNKTSKNGSGVYISSSSFQMDGGEISENSTSYGGGGVYVAADGKFTMDTGSIMGNEGAGVYARDAQQVTINGGSITENEKGGIDAEDSSLIITNTDISKNSGEYGILVDGGSFSMSGGSVTYNTAGGVSITDVSTTISNADISYNSASYAAGLATLGIASVTLQQVSVQYNTATDSLSSGGGVYAIGTTLVVQDCDIVGNTCQGTGGGIFVLDATLTLADGTNITGNSASTYGGGVYVWRSYFYTEGVVSITGNNVTSSYSGYGGGVYFNTIDGCDLSGQLTISGNTKAGTTANNLYLPAGQTVTVSDYLDASSSVGITSETEPTAYTSVYLVNAALGSVSADSLCYDGNAYAFGWDTDGKLALTINTASGDWGCACGQDHFDGSYACDWTAIGSGFTGGVNFVYGYYYLTSDITLDESIRITGDVVICLNGYTITGPGFVGNATAYPAFYIVDLTPDNDATPSLTLYDAASGTGKITCVGHVAVDVTDGEFNMYGGTITDCVNTSDAGDQGGAVWVGEGATFNMYGGAITGNTALYGGGVFVNLGTFNLYDGVISDNTATYGGAVYLTGTGYVEDNTIQFGINSAEFYMYGGEITNNQATTNGGAVYVLNTSGDSFIMSGGAIAGNYAANAYGGVYCNSLYSSEVSDYAVLSGDITITGNTEGDYKASNLCIGTRGFAFAASLGENAKIGVTLLNGDIVTEDFAGNATLENFSADGTSYYLVRTSASVLTLSTTPEPTYATADVEQLLGYLAGTVTDEQAAVDVTKNGEVAITDAILMSLYVA